MREKKFGIYFLMVTIAILLGPVGWCGGILFLLHVRDVKRADQREAEKNDRKTV
jgi:hypothetical protein